MKKKEEQPVKTEFYNKVIKDLIPFNFTYILPENIAFMVDNDSDDIVVDYNYMSTGLHYKKPEVKKEDVIEAGFKWCETWNFYER